MPSSKPIKDISCLHFKQCSGCVQNEVVDQPPIYQEMQQFFGERGISSLQMHVGQVLSWRSKAKLAVRGSVEDPQIGLFKAHSHQVVDIPLCKVHHPSINAAVEAVKTFIKQEGIVPYEERSNAGDLRYIQLTVEQSTGRIQLAFVCNHDQSNFQKWNKPLQRLWDAHPALWHSLWLNFNMRRDNVIFGKDWKLLAGECFLWEHYAGVEVCYHPASFAQANVEMFEKMLIRIKQRILQNAKIVEFYAGIGIIGLTLCDNSQWVKCCEINPLARHCFEESVRRLDPEIAAKISFYSEEASEAIHLIEEADVIIVDPPRRGVDHSLLKALQEENQVKQLIYISCGWKGFQKDYEILCNSGWKLEEVEAYLFFPGTNHIELLGVFKKV